MLNIQRFVFNPFQENCYVVSDSTNEAVIIDCGAFYGEERSTIVEHIRNNKLTVRHLLATHAHIDHNFGNNTIYDTFGISPEVHYKDSLLMKQLPEQAMVFCNYNLNYEMPPVARFIQDADTIRFGTHIISVIPAPGHTPGSVFFYCKEENIAFSGDTLFQNSIGRTDLWQGSYDDIIISLDKIGKLLPAETAILPGHGPNTTIGKEKRNNPYMQMQTDKQ